MTRRSRGSGKQTKARHRKADTPTHGTAPTTRRRSSSAVDQKSEFARLRQERDEAVNREAATSEVLRLISKSPGELEVVFRTILENAIRICEAKFGTLMRFDGTAFHYVAQVGLPSELAEFQRRRGPFKPEADGQL